jgi:hypothetical protein
MITTWLPDRRGLGDLGRQAALPGLGNLARPNLLGRALADLALPEQHRLNA